MIRLLVLLVVGAVCFVAGAVFEAVREGGTLDMHTALLATKRRADVLQASRRPAPMGRRGNRGGAVVGYGEGAGHHPTIRAGGGWQ